MTQRRALWALLTAIVALLLLVAAGCGGSSEDAADEAPPTATIPEADDSDTGTDDSEDAGDLGDVSAFANESCLELAQAAAAIGNPAGLTDVDQVADFYAQLVDRAPDEIADDLAVFAEYIGVVAEALSGVDTTSGEPPSQEALEKLQALADVDPEVQTAVENISTWAQENCTTGG